MKNFNRLNLSVMGLLFTLAMTGFATADTTLVFSGKEGMNRIYLTPSALRMDVSGKDGQQAMIYDSGRNEFIIIMPKEKQYLVMTEKDMQAIGDLRNQMMQQMEAQLADVPPAQREQMRQMMMGMMKGKMGNAGRSEPMVRYVETDETGKAMGHSCRIYETRINGSYHGDVCVTPIKALGVPANEYANYAHMLKFMQKMTQAAGVNSGVVAGMPENAMPLWYEEDNTRHELKSISHTPLDKALFAPPAGYKRQSTGLDKLRNLLHGHRPVLQVNNQRRRIDCSLTSGLFANLNGSGLNGIRRRGPI